MKKIRDVVYGFVSLDEQECEIINHPAFQRLRRIKQLSLTDMVYPGAVHTRFEHSIGVMQMASDMYDSIVCKKEAKSILQELSLDDNGIKRYRKIVRLAALLHDVGHSPFSHAGEDLMPIVSNDNSKSLHTDLKPKRYKHEDYSIALIKNVFKNLIEDHRLNENYPIKVEEVTALLGDTTVKIKGPCMLLKELISGQVDADRADYLLRDSIHLGVSYGLYDRYRLINCMTLAKTDTGSPVIAIKEGGWHIAESLVLARYQMFSQVYFHKVRRIYDHHISKICKEILNKSKWKGYYPPPEELDDYLVFDDWFIYSKIKQNCNKQIYSVILNRDHYKCIYETDIYPNDRDIKEIERLKEEYISNEYFVDTAETSWYKLDKDILISGEFTLPLSAKSSIVKSMINKPCQQRFYVIKSK